MTPKGNDMKITLSGYKSTGIDTALSARIDAIRLRLSDTWDRVEGLGFEAQKLSLPGGASMQAETDVTSAAYITPDGVIVHELSLETLSRRMEDPQEFAAFLRAAEEWSMDVSRAADLYRAEVCGRLKEIFGIL